MAVAALALFLALTGSVVAAAKLLPNNSVGTKQIRNGSIKGGDLADDTVTGDQVIESSFGTVPRAATAGTATAAGAATTASTARYADRASSAANADRAASAASADRAGSAASADRAGDADRVGGRSASDFASAQEVFTVSAKLSAGDSRVLVERDGVRLVGRCQSGQNTTSGGTADVFTILAESSADGATLASQNALLDGSTGNALGPGTAEAKRIAVQKSSNTGTRIIRMVDQGVVLTSVGGRTIFFGATAGIRVSFGLQGATCAVTAPVMVSTL